MHIEYTAEYSPQDHRDARRLHYRKQWPWFFLLFFIGILFLLDNPFESPFLLLLACVSTAIGALVGLALIYVFLIHGVVWLWWRSCYTFPEPGFQVRIDDDWLSETNPDYEWKVRWAVFQRCKEDRRLFLLYESSMEYFLIPKRLLSEEQVAVLREHLHKRFA